MTEQVDQSKIADDYSKIWNVLSQIDVSKHVEKKNGLSYLSWAYAWGVLMEEFPHAEYSFSQPELHPDGTDTIHCDVMIGHCHRAMWLPVMDGSNKSMKKTPYSYSSRYGDKTVEAATTFDINKTIMRCLVKNLAMFGLGIYIYAGEDLPEGESNYKTEAPKKIVPAVGDGLVDLKKGTENWDAVVKYVTTNKALGIEKIGAQLVRKYKISPAIKKEIANLINAE